MEPIDPRRSTNSQKDTRKKKSSKYIVAKFQENKYKGKILKAVKEEKKRIACKKTII